MAGIARNAHHPPTNQGREMMKNVLNVFTLIRLTRTAQRAMTRLLKSN